MSGKARRALVEDLAEERHRPEHVGLVDAGDAARAARALAPLREAEGEIVHALASRARVITIVSRASRSSSIVALAARREQAFGRFADHDEVDVARARIGERQRHAGNARAPAARRRRARARRAGRAAARSRCRRDSGSPASPSRRTGSRRPRAPPRASLAAARRRWPCSAARRPGCVAKRNANGAPCASLSSSGSVASMTSTPMPSPGSTQMSKVRVAVVVTGVSSGGCHSLLQVGSARRSPAARGWRARGARD